jgi:hypothetical protein
MAPTRCLAGLFLPLFVVRQDFDYRTVFQIEVLPSDPENVLGSNFAYLIDICRIKVVSQAVESVEPECFSSV